MRPPISDPFLPPADFSIETRLFKHRFWRVYFGMIPTCGLIAGWFLWTNPPGTSTSWLIFFFLVLNPFIAAISMMFRPVKVTREGVQGQSSVGFIAWDRMRRARFIWFGLPYVRVSVHKIPILALWVPLSMTDSQGFAQTVTEWAPEGNSLRTWIEKRGFGA